MVDTLASSVGSDATRLPLIEPLYEALAAHSREQPLWHGDETRWQVFATVEGKVGYRWYLGVFHAEEVVVFVLAQGRAHEVPEQYLGPDAKGIMDAGGQVPESLSRFLPWQMCPEDRRLWSLSGVAQESDTS